MDNVSSSLFTQLNMPRFEIKQTGKLNLTSHSGLALIGQCCQAAQVDDEVRRVKRNVAQAEIVDPERNIRQAERYFIDTNMLLNLPKGVAVVYGEGLPKFVSIRPLKVPKTPDAIQVKVVPGSAAPSGSDAIDVE